MEESEWTIGSEEKKPEPGAALPPAAEEWLPAELRDAAAAAPPEPAPRGPLPAKAPAAAEPEAGAPRTGAERPADEASEPMTRFFERTLRVEARVKEMERQVGRFSARVDALSTVLDDEELSEEGEPPAGRD